MRRMLRWATAGLSVLLMAASSAAGPLQCELYDSAYENAPQFKVTASQGEQRVYFYSRPDQCTGAKPCTERKKTYLVPGDVVFGGPETGGFRCAYYGSSAKGVLIAGFLPVRNLQPIGDEGELSAEFLSGHWQMKISPDLTPDTIEIKAAGADKVSASGEAYYQTTQTVNEGGFESDNVTVAKGAKNLVCRDSNNTDCQVTMRRRGPYLVVDDNRNCGGMNVTFEGIYVRTR
jgi:hypothetical protein